MASLIDPLTRLFVQLFSLPINRRKLIIFLFLGSHRQTLSSLNLPTPSPIPTTPISSFGISHPFPSLTPLLYSSILPFPTPLPPVSLPPPLPNRPRATSSVLPGMTVAPSRMGNPFAGLFGSRRPSTPVPAPAPAPAPTPAPAAAPLPLSDEKANSSTGGQAYPPPTITMGEKGTAVPEEDEAPAADVGGLERPNSRGSLRKVASSAQLPPRDTETKKDGEEEKIVPVVQAGKEDTMVAAWGVDKAIKRGEIEKLIGRAMRSMVEKELEGLPSSVVNGVKRSVPLSPLLNSVLQSDVQFLTVRRVFFSFLLLSRLADSSPSLTHPPPTPAPTHPSPNSLLDPIVSRWFQRQLSRPSPRPSLTPTLKPARTPIRLSLDSYTMSSSRLGREVVEERRMGMWMLLRGIRRRGSWRRRWWMECRGLKGL